MTSPAPDSAGPDPPGNAETSREDALKLKEEALKLKEEALKLKEEALQIKEQALREKNPEEKPGQDAAKKEGVKDQPRGDGSKGDGSAKGKGEDAPHEDADAVHHDAARPDATVPQQRPAWRRWAWLPILVAVVVVAYLIYHHEKHAAKAKGTPPPPATPVTATAARKGDIGVYLMGLGTVTPVYTATIYSRVQGEIQRVDYREGQMVHKGDSLVVVDPRPYQAALLQAQGALARDQATLKEAEIDLNRYQLAFQRKAIAKQQLDDQEQVAKQDRGAVMADEGALQTAQVNLAFCYIKSPIDGRVGLRLLDPGNMVQANSTTALVVVTQIQPITVIFSLSEDYLSQIQEPLRKGETLEVAALDRAQEKKLATGSLLTLDNLIDTTTGTVKLRAIFPNQDGALFANQFVNARILVQTHHGVTLIPAAAIQRNAQGAFVYLITPTQTAAMRTVKVGTLDGETAEVQGVSPGDEIATNGFDKLHDGAHVSLQKPSSAAPQAQKDTPQ